MWRCRDKETVTLDPQSRLGIFYSRDSYIFLFSYMTKNREGPGERPATIMYFWLGKDATASEKGAVALLIVELDKEYGAPQVRVEQGKEPEDFVAIYGNRMIIRGGSEVGYDEGKVALFQVHGSATFAVRAEQLEAVRKWEE